MHYSTHIFRHFYMFLLLFLYIFIHFLCIVRVAKVWESNISSVHENIFNKGCNSQLLNYLFLACSSWILFEFSTLKTYAHIARVRTFDRHLFNE